ncbi:MAG: hypothetical protein WC972_07370 [Trueperaceae bacterium]
MSGTTHSQVGAVRVERTLEGSGSTVRLLLEPLPGERVRIREYYRRRKDQTRFERVREQEGQSVTFELLRLERSFAELFPQAGLFDGLPPTRRRR